MGKCPGGPNAHLDPRQWNKGKSKDGTVRFFCKHCRKFIGAQPPVKDAK